MITGIFFNIYIYICIKVYDELVYACVSGASACAVVRIPPHVLHYHALFFLRQLAG